MAWMASLAVLALFPLAASADEHRQALQVQGWATAPFAILLLCIAVLPLVAQRFWHSNLNKLALALGLSAPIVGYFVYLDFATGQPALERLAHQLAEYVDFIMLLAALYTIAGGIVVQGSLRASPEMNCGLLGLGAVLANFVGTTGASMLLIRPMLRMNQPRKHHGHIPLFFIFLVSNVGGLLTPLGDPPLFLGFLYGVDFFWTLSLWRHWLIAVGLMLAIFVAWDWAAFAHEPPAPSGAREPLRLKGLWNVVFLAGVLAAVLLQSPRVTRHLPGAVDGAHVWTLQHPWPALAMGGLAALSWFTTPKKLREANDFSWFAIIEIAVLFLGIFITMVPALAYLHEHRDQFAITEPWEYFWLTGLLSSFLDNAPTYMTFAALAAEGGTLEGLSLNNPRVLQGISAGAVFMGAMTYIGNGPNFLVKIIAESMGYRMPSFFGYLACSALVLLPVFALVTLLLLR